MLEPALVAHGALTLVAHLVADALGTLAARLVVGLGDCSQDRFKHGLNVGLGSGGAASRKDGGGAAARLEGLELLLDDGPAGPVGQRIDELGVGCQRQLFVLVDELMEDVLVEAEEQDALLLLLVGGFVDCDQAVDVQCPPGVNESDPESDPDPDRNVINEQKVRWL